MIQRACGSDSRPSRHQESFAAQVYAWGSNASGQLGRSHARHSHASPRFVQVLSISFILSTFLQHTLSLSMYLSLALARSLSLSLSPRFTSCRRDLTLSLPLSRSCPPSPSLFLPLSLAVRAAGAIARRARMHFHASPRFVQVLCLSLSL